ncbi:L-type lectin family protein [Empedobacter sedimenti]|uniref:hypothetical protein n=1 Tax=Empedobacter sedimenti TaxID=3042610 RepID=UPI0024A64F88|nr:hypothetical protein [Empedobacter sedimenti]
MSLNKLKFLLSAQFFILCVALSAQFIIDESFKNSSVGSNVITGDNALLTSGKGDAVGDGWLRLTANTGNQKGFAYINETFPSEQGVTIEFDYKTWGGSGADGFTVFLFDGNYGPTGANIFKTGAFGGALGYSKSNSGAGMTGGYIGIGFDEYGNYASTAEGKNGGAGASLYKNYVSIRGIAPDYKYLFGKAYSSGIAYTKSGSTRPTDANFYRRVKIEITPENGSYRIKTFLKSSITGAFVEHFSTVSAEKPYKTLKVGFAGSTGGSTNYHEIRNVTVKTPGGISVKKSANKTHLAEASTPNPDANRITYTIEVSNFQSATVSDIEFIDIIQDANGIQLNTNQFVVESIQLSGFVNNTTSLLQNVNNKISGILGLEKFTEGTVTVVGRYVGAINGNRIKNSVSVNSVLFEDDNLENNKTFVLTDILKANDDIFRWGSAGMYLGTNDKLDGLNTVLIFDGTSKNSSISTIGTWPTGITLDTKTGKVNVTAGTTMPTTPLQYQICNLTGTCSIAKVIFYDKENDLSITSSVDNQCGYNGETNNYTLTIKNNSPFPIVTSASDKVNVKFNVNNYLAYDKLETFNAQLGDNSKWNMDESYNANISNDYTFTLKDNTTIPANGEITLQFAKNWNTDIFNAGERDINSLNISLNYLNASNTNIDGDLSNNTNFVSVFWSKTIKVPSVSTQKVNQHDKITVGEMAGLGPNTNGYKFYLEDEVTEIPSNYLVPTATSQSFSFMYKSACDNNQMLVKVDVGFPDPGKITLTSGSEVNEKIVCYGGEIAVLELQKATSSQTTRFIYTWEISFDDGVTWNKSADVTNDDGNVEVAGQQSITLTNITRKTKVRRVAKMNKILGGSDNVSATSNEVTINVQEENQIILPGGVNSFAIKEGDVFTFPTISGKLPSTIKIFDSQGTVVGSSVSGLQKGDYTFTVEATTTSAAAKEGCVSYATIRLIVYDLNDCNTVTKKVFATKAVSWTSGASGVANKDNAVNGNRADYATITGGVVILGIGTVGIDLYFTKPNGTLYTPAELKGKKVTVKLGEQYSGVKLAGAVTIVGRKTDNGVTAGNVGLLNASNVGDYTPVKGGLLDLLKGDNVFHFSFAPSSKGVPIEYNGIRIQLGSLLGVADLATVFHAYIEEEENINAPGYTPQGDIVVNPPASLLYPTEQRDVDGDKLLGISNTNIKLNSFVHDVTWGNRSEVLNVASGLASVVHPYYSVDDNYDSYTLFNATAGVLNKQFLRTHLRQPARPGDQVQITLAYPNINVLNLSLLQLGNFKIVYYLGDTKVGEEKMEKFRMLDIGLFNFKDKRRAVISKPITIPFDSFEIEQFNTVNVNLGDGLHVHDIRIAPMMLFEGQEDPKEVATICAADLLAIQSPDYCTDYEISFAKILEFGEPYLKEDGTELVDKEGNPIKTITKVEDIPNSKLRFSHLNSGLKYYHIDRLYPEFENEGLILIKVQTKRQGLDYGNPQYLRVKLNNCNEAIVNPVIKFGAN